MTQTVSRDETPDPDWDEPGAVLHSVPAEPRTPADRSLGYLHQLRNCAARLLSDYREAWSSTGADGEQHPEQQTVAAIGLLHTRPASSSDAPVMLQPSTGSRPKTPASSTSLEYGGSTGGPGGGAVGLFPGLGLSRSGEAVVAAAWWATADPQVAAMFGWIHDDATRRYPSLSALRLLLEPEGLVVPLALPPESGPVATGLLQPVMDAAAPVRLTPTAALLMDGWLPPLEQAAGPLPARLRPVAGQARALIAAGHRVALRCIDTSDGWAVARGVAAALGRSVESLDEPIPVAQSLHEHAGGAGRGVAEVVLLDRMGLVLPVGSTAREPVQLRVAEPGAACGHGWHVLDVGPIATSGVTKAWRRALGDVGLDTSAAAELAARMRLSEETIGLLSATARESAEVERRHLTVEDLHEAVRRHPQHSLADVARLITPSLRLDDLVLPSHTRAGLDDLVAHARYGAQVLDSMPGAGERGRGIAVLLHGPSGTGKTAATEAIASELGRDLWIADLAQVVSKWLGETSHNLDRLLTEAARAGAVLLFDEAEGLFGRRAEVTDARDRYANLEIDHLLQRIELHDGLVVLTSNRPAALDDGFQRRLRLSVRFEVPDHSARQTIWERLLPADQRAGNTALDDVAVAELSGAAIRAAALAALVYAAAEGTRVENDHLHRAVARELEKSGRTWAGPFRRRDNR